MLVPALLHPNGGILRGSSSGVIPQDTDSHIHISITYETPSEAPVAPKAERIVDRGIIDRLRENFAYRYPYEPLLSVEAKTSVSVLANKAESIKYAFSDRPAFMNAGGLTAAQRGTATHKVMQFIDFEKAQYLDQEIERLVEWQYLSDEEAEAVNRQALWAFFQSDLFCRICASKQFRREMRFLTELPAKMATPDLPDKFASETVIVQGSVDLCFEEEDGVVVLDFKTDRTDNPDALAEAYGKQLAVYALACEKIFQKPVKQTLIYSFALSAVIEIKNPGKP